MTRRVQRRIEAFRKRQYDVFRGSNVLQTVASVQNCCNFAYATAPGQSQPKVPAVTRP